MKNRKALTLLFSANILSGIAQGISMISIPWYVNSILNQPDLFGGMYAFSCFISIFWAIAAGVIVDRYDRKKVFMGVNLVGGIVLTTIAALGYANQGLSGFLVMLVLVFTFLIYTIHYPTLFAFAQEVTPPEHYNKVTSLIEIQGQLAAFLAGAFAMILLQGGDSFQLFGLDISLPFRMVPWQMHEIFMLDGLSYFIAIAILFFVKYESVAKRIIDSGTVRERMLTGYNYIKQNPAFIWFAMGTAGVFMTIITGNNQVLPVYVADVLHASGSAYASGEMCFALGAVFAGLSVRYLLHVTNAFKGIMALSLVGFLVYGFYIQFPAIPLFMFFCFLIGWANAGIRILRVSVTFRIVPNGVFGRVNSFTNVVFTTLRLFVILLLTFPFFNNHPNHSFFLMSCIILVGAGFAWAFGRDSATTS
jgi:Na+/melibiose symporter-like transporter